MSSNASNMNVIDLFCGVGGFSLGAARAGFNVIGAVDNDANALKAHGINFPGTIHLNIDLSKAEGKDLLREFKIESKELLCIIGGPPCQGFSAIGKKDDSDPRNQLFVHFFRLVSEIKPTIFLCENVPGFLADKHSAIRERAFNYVIDDYVILPPMTLDASLYGAPTSRIRAFFLGYSRDGSMGLEIDKFKPPKDIRKVTVRKALKGLPRKINPSWQTEQDDWRICRSGPDGAFGDRLQGMIPKGVGDSTAIKRLREDKKVSGCIGTLHSKEVMRRYGKIVPGAKDNISKALRLDPKGFCPTLRAGTGSDHGSFQAVRPIHYSKDRVITPREAARLQGFPDWYQFDHTKWHSFKLIGNSVSPILAEHILKVILDASQTSSKER
ncbi:MAG: DNA cytosine methyltransferase [Deltaproteobacteria bacterium]|nr:DNA cytosine methyltransferase [Deltaproteobacteria bacterium]